MAGVRVHAVCARALGAVHSPNQSLASFPAQSIPSSSTSLPPSTLSSSASLPLSTASLHTPQTPRFSLESPLERALSQRAGIDAQFNSTSNSNTVQNNNVVPIAVTSPSSDTSADSEAPQQETNASPKYCLSMALASIDVSREREKDAHRTARDHGDAIPTLNVSKEKEREPKEKDSAAVLTGSASLATSLPSVANTLHLMDRGRSSSSSAIAAMAVDPVTGVPLSVLRRLSSANSGFVTRGVVGSANVAWDEHFELSVDSALDSSAVTPVRSISDGDAIVRGRLESGKVHHPVLSSPELSPERDDASQGVSSPSLRSLRARSPDMRSSTPTPCWCLVLAVGVQTDASSMNPEIEILATSIIPLRRLSIGEHKGWCTLVPSSTSAPRRSSSGQFPAVYLELEHLGSGAPLSSSVPHVRKSNHALDLLSPKSKRRLSAIVDKQVSLPRSASVTSADELSSELGRLLETDKGRAIVSSAMKKSERNRQKSEAFALKWDLPAGETVHQTWSAALHRNILIHGRLVLTDHYLVFHSNIFGVKTVEVVDLHDVIDIRKNRKNLSLGIEVTLRARDNAKKSVLNFASFFARDKAFTKICLCWQECKSDDAVLSSPLSDSATIRSDSGSGDRDTIDDDLEDGDEDEDEVESVDSFELNDGILVSETDDNTEFLQADSSRMTPASAVTLSGCSSIAKFFTKFWADDQFYRKYHQERGDDKIELSEWAELSTLQNGAGTQNPSDSPTFRQGQFLSPYKAPFFAQKNAANAARCEETQRYHLTKQQLVVEARQYMMDVPFGDYFCVESRWVAKEAEGGIRVEGFVGVHFFKKTIFSSKIASEVIKQTTASFELWLKMAQSELDSTPQAGSAPASRSSIRTSRSDAQPAQQPPVVQQPSVSEPTIVATTTRDSYAKPKLDVVRSFGLETILANWALFACLGITLFAGILVVLDMWSAYAATALFGLALVLLLERHLFVLQERVATLQRTQAALEADLNVLRTGRREARALRRASSSDLRSRKSKEASEVNDTKAT